jgi:hypothetical protein
VTAGTYNNVTVDVHGIVTAATNVATGTVTSVGLSMPTTFAVGGTNPVTTSGTISVLWANQNANLVLAGPTSGPASQPTFRGLVAADLPAGTGTVTSVGLSMPTMFNVGGTNPVTTSGTISVLWANQNANLVLAGPTSGPASQPTFRALGSADLPAAVAYTNTSNVWTQPQTFHALTSYPAVVITAVAGQSALICAWQNSAGANVSWVDQNGVLSGNGSGLSGVPVTGLAGTLAISQGGTGQTTANAALNALLPAQAGNANHVLQTDGANTSWVAAGAAGDAGSITYSAGNAAHWDSVQGPPITVKGALDRLARAFAVLTSPPIYP